MIGGSSACEFRTVQTHNLAAADAKTCAAHSNEWQSKPVTVAATGTAATFGDEPMSIERTNLIDQLLDHQPGKKKPVRRRRQTGCRFYAFVTGVQDRAQNIEFRKAEGGLAVSGIQLPPWWRACPRGGIHFAVRHRRAPLPCGVGTCGSCMMKILRHRVTWTREGKADEQVPGRRAVRGRNRRAGEGRRVALTISEQSRQGRTSRR